MVRVTIVGCGNIGSRLLQSLVQTSRKAPNDRIEITCIDPNEPALRVADQRAREVLAAEPSECGVELRFSTALKDAPEHADLAILASTSDVRRRIFEELADHASIDRVLFEKFLFTEREDYQRVSDRLASAGMQAWVHCPRPEWPGYRQLKELIGGAGPLRMRVTGSNWALASNAIHFLAAFSYLTDERLEAFDGTHLDRDRIENKRGGFYEVSGTMFVHGERGSVIEMTSIRDGKLDLRAEILCAAGRFQISELSKTMLMQTEDTNWEAREAPFAILRASEMAAVFDNMLSDQDVLLPTYEEAVPTHLELMNIYNRVFFGEAGLRNTCPVT